MNRRFHFLLAACLLLAACMPSPPPPPPPEPAAPLEERLAELPGAEIVQDPLGILYPGNRLFAEGAVLPLPGGTEVLDPLAAFLLDRPERRWRGTVRARTGISEEYDRSLAAKRADLLRRYFENRGVSAEQLVLESEAAEGPPLELAPRGGTPTEGREPGD